MQWLVFFRMYNLGMNKPYNISGIKFYITDENIIPLDFCL